MIGKHGFFSQQQRSLVEPITENDVQEKVILPVSILTDKVSKLKLFRTSESVDEAHKVLVALNSALKAQLPTSQQTKSDDSKESAHPTLNQSPGFKAGN